MRRPHISCQRAVQSLHASSLHHIWISDDQLSIAINSFFRKSCQHQKRHGSHVPGPLEARRRAAKRRMTISAGFYPQENWPSSYSLGTLFGFRRNPQPSWRYQPPSLPDIAAPVDASVTPAPSNTVPFDLPTNPACDHYPASDAHADPDYIAPNISKSSETILREDPAGLETTARPKTAAVATVHNAVNEVVDINACFENFKSRIDIANGTDQQLLYRAFVLSCPPCVNIWAYNVLVVEHLLKSKWDPMLLFALANKHGRPFVLPPPYTAAHRQLLETVERISITFPKHKKELHSLYMRLAEAAADAEKAMNTTQDAELVSLCRQLWLSSHSLDPKLDSSTIGILCAVISKIQNVHTGAALHSILTKMYGKSGPRHAFMHLVSQISITQERCIVALDVLRCVPRTLLLDAIPMFTLHLSYALEKKTRVAASLHRERWNTWFSLIFHYEEESGENIRLLDVAINTLARDVFHSATKTSCTRRFADRSRPDTLLRALIFALSEQDVSYTAVKVNMTQLIDSKITATQREPQNTEERLANVLLLFKQASLPYSKLTDAVVALLAQHGTTSSLLKFMTILQHNKFVLGDTAALDAVIRKGVAGLQQQTDLQSNTQRQHFALNLHNFRMVSGILNRIASVPPTKRQAVKATIFSSIRSRWQFEHIMNRADAVRALPLAFCNLSADISPENRVELIHQLAHQYSLDTTRTHREVWRAIYYLYRHLREHSLSIGSLFSRAVVRVSITRPLSEHRFVSARRLIWVCHLVARVEGADVARKIENDFWLWRGDLIEHAKRVHDSIGANRMEKAHIGKMKKLGLI